MIACERLYELSGEDKPVCDRGLFVQLRTIRRILRSMRFKFAWDIPLRERRINYVIATAVLGLGIYHCMFTIFMIVTTTSSSQQYKLASALVSLNWTCQSVVSAFFFIQWQQSNTLREFVSLLQIPQRFKGCHKGERLLQLVLSFMIVIMGTITCIHLLFLFIVVLNIPQMPFIYGRLDMIKREFYFEALAFVPSLLGIYLNCLWAIALFTYILFTTAAYLEFKEYNNRLRKLGKDANAVFTEKTLIDLIEMHRALAQAVRKLDKLFKAYAFVMIASNIPATIFSILLIASSSNLPLLHLLFAIPSILFCIIELVGLTWAPAMLHGAICKSNTLLFSNQKIWSPYRPVVYQVASSLLCHLNQTNLGVSIWGFAVVTKPLILTTLSVILTMLAFLLEMRRNH